MFTRRHVPKWAPKGNVITTQWKLRRHRRLRIILFRATHYPSTALLDMAQPSRRPLQADPAWPGRVNPFETNGFSRGMILNGPVEIAISSVPLGYGMARSQLQASPFETQLFVSPGARSSKAVHIGISISIRRLPINGIPFETSVSPGLPSSFHPHSDAIRSVL